MLTNHTAEKPILHQNLHKKVKQLMHGLAGYVRKMPPSSFARCNSTFHSSISTSSNLFSFLPAHEGVPSLEVE